MHLSRPLPSFSTRLSRPGGNARAIAQMASTWRRGGGVLPRWMGLSSSQFREVTAFYFGGVGLPPSRSSVGIPKNRQDEIVDLRALLLSHRAGKSRSEVWVAEIICAGCIGGGHLWHDLGLFSRAELGALIQRNFPTLHAKNIKNMRWKKFFYKQLCEGEGVYICRSPSCEACPEFVNCFSSDE